MHSSSCRNEYRRKQEFAVPLTSLAGFNTWSRFQEERARTGNFSPKSAHYHRLPRLLGVSSPPPGKGVAEWEAPVSRREEGVKMVCGRGRIRLKKGEGFCLACLNTAKGWEFKRKVSTENQH